MKGEGTESDNEILFFLIRRLYDSLENGEILYESFQDSSRDWSFLNSMIMKLIYALLSFSKRYPVKEASKKL